MWRAIKLVATGIGWLLMAAGFLLIVYIVTFAQAFAAEPPAPGMTCTYTPPTAAAASPSRTYVVEVGSTFEASYERDGRPWLWVKRPSEARYQSVIVSPATLSGCR